MMLKTALRIVDGAAGMTCLSMVLSAQALARGRPFVCIVQAAGTPAMALLGARLAAQGMPVVVTPVAVIEWIAKGMPT